MSLFPTTDEDKAYQRGYARGKEGGMAAKHCGHECNGQVCEKYNTLHFEGGQFDEPCSLGNICDYDTRTHGPVPAERPIIASKIWRIPVTEPDDDYPGASITSYIPIPKEIVSEIQAQATAAENKRVLEAMGQLKDSCECIPLKEFAPDFDRGFHQAMTLVRGWIDQEVESLRLAQPELKERDSE